MNIETKQQTREQMAWEEVGHTSIRPGAARVLVGMFLLACAAVPLGQMAGEWRAAKHADIPFHPQVFDLARQMPDITTPFRTKGLGVSSIVEANRLLLQHLHVFEDRLDDESRLGQWIRPRLQTLLSGSLGVGNEQAYIGRDGWLFYRPDMDYLTGPGFLDPHRLAQRAKIASEWKTLPHPDPRPAILDFKRQLDARGIQLIVMPIPAKPTVHPEKYASVPDGEGSPLQNRSYREFIQTLEREGVIVFDPTDILIQRKRQTGLPQYLETDTHWRPEAMEAVAQELAQCVNAILVDEEKTTKRDNAAQALSVQTIEWRALGDIALMLDLPKDQSLFPPESVPLRQILVGEGQFWKASVAAEVLLLGDSFSNIYSLEAMGWGEAAGFAEQFAFHLGEPVDRLVRNDAGAFATRDMLCSELARGRDRLDGKRVVIWQFAARELASGDWRLLKLERRDPPKAAFFIPPPGETLVVSGMVQEVSPAPRPGSVPYRDHIIAIHLVDLPENGEAVIYMHSMVDNEWTRAARLRNGEEITISLRPWADVAARYDGINRSELDDVNLQLQEPCWGEWIQ